MESMKKLHSLPPTWRLINQPIIKVVLLLTPTGLFDLQVAHVIKPTRLCWRSCSPLQLLPTGHLATILQAPSIHLHHHHLLFSLHTSASLDLRIHITITSWCSKVSLSAAAFIHSVAPPPVVGLTAAVGLHLKPPSHQPRHSALSSPHKSAQRSPASNKTPFHQHTDLCTLSLTFATLFSLLPLRSKARPRAFSAPELNKQTDRHKTSGWLVTRRMQCRLPPPLPPHHRRRARPAGRARQASLRTARGSVSRRSVRLAVTDLPRQRLSILVMNTRR
jgi:hypothetical protein